MVHVQTIAEFIAVLACGLFTGAAIYINLVEHPARMQWGVEIAVTEFAPSYRRAAVVQVSLAALRGTTTDWPARSTSLHGSSILC